MIKRIEGFHDLKIKKSCESRKITVQTIGEKMEPIIDELNEVLVA